MAAGIAELLRLFDLEAIEVNIFRGHSLDAPLQRVFGGQVAAQALVAAGRTVDHGQVHSTHAYFLRPGDPTIPILYEVDRIHDGRSITTRRVVAIQHGQAIFNLQSSFHIAEEGFADYDEMPDVPDPNGLTLLSDELAAHPDVAERSLLGIDGLDLAFITELPWTRGADEEARQQLWFRTTESLPDDPLLHAAFVTFASDLTLIDTITRRHGYALWDEALAGASLDHCMWFHQPFRADDWLLYDQHSPAAYGGRGLSLGALYVRDGTRVATVSQEGLIRKRRTT